jgi:uridine kinase
LGIYLKTPRKTIEIHLPGGKVISGPRGASIEQLLSIFPQKQNNPIVGVIINNELRELSFPVKIDSYVLPITMADNDGSRIYRRSLTFLLSAAFNDLFPGSSLTIDHSVASGGYYCQTTQPAELSSVELEQLESKMRELVTLDIPFIREEVPINEAIQYFQSIGAEDKVELLKYRQKKYLTLYRLRSFKDYHHGYMVPSTGYIKWFSLIPTNGGFTVRFPRRHNPTQISPLPEYPKLLLTFRQYGDWLQKLGISTVGSLNKAIEKGRIHEVILISEAFHDLHIANIASTIAEQSDQVRFVLIAGPSSSGKTTFSKRLSIALLAKGINPFPLEMDNYFLDRDLTPKGDDGNPDFESISALATEDLAKDLRLLSSGEIVELPKYNFITGKSEAGQQFQLRSGEIILLEGIHGLNPKLLPGTLTGQIYRIYVSALTQLNLDHQNRLSTTDTRLVRRIARDSRERGLDCLTTLKRWESVHQGEKKNIFPYQENADVIFNSALVYELAALATIVRPLLLQVAYGTREYIEAKRLLALIDWFIPIDHELVPDNSILREFIGKSILKNLTLWKP